MRKALQAGRKRRRTLPPRHQRRRRRSRGHLGRYQQPRGACSSIRQHQTAVKGTIAQKTMICLISLGPLFAPCLVLTLATTAEILSRMMMPPQSTVIPLMRATGAMTSLATRGMHPLRTGNSGSRTRSGRWSGRSGPGTRTTRKGPLPECRRQLIPSQARSLHVLSLMLEHPPRPGGRCHTGWFMSSATARWRKSGRASLWCRWSRRSWRPSATMMR